MSSDCLPVNLSDTKIAVIGKKPFFNSLTLPSNIYTAIVTLFIFAFVLDMIIVEKRKVIRFVGHNIDHILYLLLILALVGVFGKGIII